MKEKKSWKDSGLVSLNIDEITHLIIKTQAAAQGITIKELIKRKFTK